MKKIFILTLCAFSIFNMTSCGISENSNKFEANQYIGEIGDNTGITKGQVAKIIALIFNTQKQIDDLNTENDIDWYTNYLLAVQNKGIFTEENTDKFKADDFITLKETQEIMDILDPEFATEISLTDSNYNKAISYNLFIEVLSKVLGNSDFDFTNYGISKKTAILVESQESNAIFIDEILKQTGYDLSKYTYQEISLLVKDGEVVALLEVLDLAPNFSNVYYTVNDNQLNILGNMDIIFDYNGNEKGSGFGNIIINDDNIAEIEPLEKLPTDTIRRFDTNTNLLYLENYGTIPLSEDFKFYNENNVLNKDYQFISGTNVTDFYVENGELKGAKMNELPIPYDIKVLLGGGTHNKIDIKHSGEFTFENSSTTKKFKNETATLTPDLDWFEDGEVLKVLGGEVNISFDGGAYTNYKGAIEIEVIDGKLVVVETSNMEEYLKGVVPHEMPSSFGESALEAQAICARSYAYNEFFINEYGHFGANITDSTASQVYSGSETTSQAVSAVENTDGLCLVSGNKVAQTYFYSTSSGFGARDIEVWSFDGTFSGDGKSYLQGKQHGVVEAMPTNEEEWLEVLGDWDIEGYDENSPFYRWKVYFSKAQLEEILKSKLVEVYNDTKNKIKVKTGDSDYVDEAPTDLGNLKNIFVAQRGESGVVEILQIEFTNKTVQVATENTIRKCLVPRKMTVGDEIYLQRKDGALVSTQTMLPSGFFAINEMYFEGELSGIALYGGGFGHGVGLSQYGAKELSDRGFTAEEILKQYYENVEVAKVF